MKAYDRVSHQYIFKLIDTLKIGNILKNWIQMSYENEKTRILLKGQFTREVSVFFGVRQSDTLSLILFNLCYDVIIIRFNKCLSDIPATYTVILKTILYAEDSIIFLSDKNDEDRMNFDLSRYELATRAKVNFNKTLALNINGSTLTSGSKILAVDIHVKYLGFYINKNGIDETLTIEKKIQWKPRSIKLITRKQV
jgi:hypothetical protein